MVRLVQSCTAGPRGRTSDAEKGNYALRESTCGGKMNSSASHQSVASNAGVLYIALGDPYIAAGINSALSLRAAGVDWPISFVASRPEHSINRHLKNNLRPLVWRHEIMASSLNRFVKTQAIQYSPFYNTLLLDSDTVIKKDFREHFAALLQFDVGAKLNRYGQTRASKQGLQIAGLGEINTLPHWNTGVIYFRKSPKAHQFFRNWHDAYRELGVEWDQAGFVSAVFGSSASFISLDDRWNAHGLVPKSEALIHHYTSAISRNIAVEIRRCAMQVDGLDATELAHWIVRRRAARRQKLGWHRYLIEKAVALVLSDLR